MKRAKKAKAKARGKQWWDFALTERAGRLQRGPKRRPPSKKRVQEMSRALARRLAARGPGAGDRVVQGVSAGVQGVTVRPGSKLYFVRRLAAGDYANHVVFGMFTSHQRAAGFMDHRDKTQLTLRPWREMFEVSWVRVIA